MTKRAISDEMRNAILQAFRNRRTIMASNNGQVIRNYLLTLHADTPEAIEAYKQASNAELLQAARLLIEDGMTEAELNAPTAEWSMETDTVTITVRRSENSERTALFRRVDDEWL